MPAAHLAEISPSDDANLELVNRVHPPAWRNPRPSPKYDLVVMGGGTAGLVSELAADLGVTNVHRLWPHRRGRVLTGPDGGSADIVTSNCVINLSPDKPAVLREVWRVLEDGCRAVIADIVSVGTGDGCGTADGSCC